MPEIIDVAGQGYPGQEVDLNHMTSGSVRRGCFALFTMILTGGSCGQAAAEDGKERLRHARSPASEARGSEPAKSVPQQQAGLGPMRYYGGPKSPMWRAPAEN